MGGWYSHSERGLMHLSGAASERGAGLKHLMTPGYITDYVAQKSIVSTLKMTNQIWLLYYFLLRAPLISVMLQISYLHCADEGQKWSRCDGPARARTSRKNRKRRYRKTQQKKGRLTYETITMITIFLHFFPCLLPIRPFVLSLCPVSFFFLVFSQNLWRWTFDCFFN